MNTIISPSILSADFNELAKEVTPFNTESNIWLHLDIMDGHFVPNLTFGATVIKNLSKVANHPLDAHLMVKNPEDYIESLAKIGVHNYTFHWEAVTHHDRLVAEAKKHFKSVGISLNPSTDVTVIPKYLLTKLDLVLLMSVNPGFGGQSFIDGVKDKIKTLDSYRKKHNLNFQIQVDGGVTDQNAKELIDLGANNLVAGSFIFKESQDNYIGQVNKLR